MKPSSGSSRIVDFTQGKVTKQLVTFAAPLFLSGLLQIVYNMVDMIIVGQKLGKVGLSGVSIGGDVSQFLTFLAMGFSNAGQVLIAQFIGKKQRERIGKFVGTMFTFLMCCAVVISIVCLVLREPILRLMNTPPESYDEALSYATVCMIGLVFIYGYNIVSAVLRGMGDSVRPFIFISISAVTNIILDILLVLVFDLRSMGAAIATVFSQALSFTLCACYILRHRDKYEFTLKAREFFHIDKFMLVSLIKLGLPMAIKSASIQFSKLFVNSWINSYGVSVSGFSGIAHKINSVSLLVSNSFNTAGATMVGQNIGAGQYDRVKKIMFAVFRITFSIAAVLSVVMLLFPETVFRLFTGDPDVIAIGMVYKPIAVLIFFGSAARSGMNALINGSGNYKMNFVTAILDGIVMRIGLALLFGLVFDMKHIGFWLGDALAGFTPSIIGLWFYFSGKWKRSAV